MEIIIPAAGLSSRFPNMRPKYSLVDHNGNLMLKNAIEPYLMNYKIHIGILQKHNEEYDLVNKLNYEFGSLLNIVIIDKPTSGPADTVYQIIKKTNINLNSEIFIKDCDSFFNHNYEKGNYICVSSFNDIESIRNPSSKSYIISNENGIIQTIAEKKVISDKFCVGGYKFESANLFCEAFENLFSVSGEIYVSNIIQYCLHKGKIFTENKVTDYIDVGTSKEWFNYTDKSVIFCDIDGTIIKAQNKLEYKNKPVPLEKNINKIKELIENDNEIIFVTSRSESSREDTLKQLHDIGFYNFKLIMGLKNCKRILINDFNFANPYPRAIAINIPRDSDTLDFYLNI